MSDVEKYYDEWTSRYLEVYGDVIQAYRPAETEALLDYTLESAQIEDGMHILDAGCGVCGPAVHFARRLPHLRIEAVTISQVQVEEGKKRIDKWGLHDRVHVRKGDYHHLDQYFPENHFDLVVFLEALGHAVNPSQVIEGAARVVKSGGFIYIKDFFPLETDDEHLQKRVDEVVGNINDIYTYNTLDLHETITALRKAGFLLVYIKRPGYESDINIRRNFEDKFGIDTHGGKPEFMPAEWLEIKCQKIWWNNGKEE
ncbi:MAG: class I SAM-dependent methyltransferase [Bacteroidia bacterium]|nr:class I SAM-dependent methyltransferase [Bacteroidia bacterium]